MPTHVHELDASRDAEFLSQGRRDPLTQNQFEPGDEVVICADCKGAQYASTWHRNGGCADPHCDGNQMLPYLPEAGELDFTGGGTSTDAQLQVLQSDRGAPDSEDEPEADPGQGGGRDEGGVVDRGRTGDTATNWPTVIIGLITVGLIGVILSEAMSSGSSGTSSDSGSPNLTSTEEYVDRAVEDLRIVSTEEAVRTLKNMASDHPDRKVVDALEKARADLNQVGDDWAPLHKVARAETRADIELARLLLEAGFDPDIEGYFSNTPLHVAASAGNAEVVRLLIEAGADPNAKNDDGNIDFYGGPDAHDGQTPLHKAAEEGNEEIVRILLQAGANPNLTDSGGRTALEDAGNDQVKRILREGMRR